MEIQLAGTQTAAVRLVAAVAVTVAFYPSVSATRCCLALKQVNTHRLVCLSRRRSYLIW